MWRRPRKAIVNRMDKFYDPFGIMSTQLCIHRVVIGFHSDDIEFVCLDYYAVLMAVETLSRAAVINNI
jgi:hypothetical protein